MTNLFAQKVGEAENPSKSRYILKLHIMKKLLLIPALTLLVVLGMSFASENPEPEIKDQANDYLLINGEWEEIAEQSCTTTGPEDCRVQLGENGPIYRVYDEMNVSSLKKSTSDDPTVIPPPF